MIPKESAIVGHDVAGPFGVVFVTGGPEEPELPAPGAEAQSDDGFDAFGFPLGHGDQFVDRGGAPGTGEAFFGLAEPAPQPTKHVGADVDQGVLMGLLETRALKGDADSAEAVHCGLSFVDPSLGILAGVAATAQVRQLGDQRQDPVLHLIEKQQPQHATVGQGARGRLVPQLRQQSLGLLDLGFECGVPLPQLLLGHRQRIQERPRARQPDRIRSGEQHHDRPGVRALGQTFDHRKQTGRGQGLGRAGGQVVYHAGPAIAGEQHEHAVFQDGVASGNDGDQVLACFFGPAAA